MKPEELSQQLREGSGKFLERRRGIVGLSLVSLASMGLISLYQMGIIKHLPEPPIPGFNAEEVDASAQAYSYLSTPDGVLGIANYAATMVLAAMGGQDRAREQPLIPLMLAAKVLMDAGGAAKLTVDQWAKHRAFCFWCLLAAGTTFATVPLALPEARAALRHIRQND